MLKQRANSNIKDGNPENKEKQEDLLGVRFFFITSKQCAEMSPLNFYILFICFICETCLEFSDKKIDIKDFEKNKDRNQVNSCAKSKAQTCFN